MKNSSLTKILFITSAVPLIAVLAALRFLPEKIPAHFDFNMNIDRWGSKYESLIMPAVTVLMSAYMYAMSRFAAKRENGKSNQKVMLICGTAINILFTAMTVCFLNITFKTVNDIKTDDVGFIKIIFILLGAVIVVTGNFLPKCKLNSVIGIRTKWSMANEDVWFKCQRFGGILFVLCGISMVVISAALNSIFMILAVNIFISVIILIGSAIGSKIIYDRQENKNI